MWRCPHDNTRQTLIMMCWSPGLASWGACIVNFRSNKMWSLHRPGWRFEHNLDLGWSWWVLLVLVGLGGKCLQHFMPIPFKALHTECWYIAWHNRESVQTMQYLHFWGLLLKNCGLESFTNAQLTSERAWFWETVAVFPFPTATTYMVLAHTHIVQM